jgi:hypothetical protein
MWPSAAEFARVDQDVRQPLCRQQRSQLVGDEPLRHAVQRHARRHHDRLRVKGNALQADAGQKCRNLLRRGRLSFGKTGRVKLS